MSSTLLEFRMNTTIIQMNTHGMELAKVLAMQPPAGSLILANSLILAYVSQALPWITQSPDHSKTITQGFDAFMDDTTIMNVAANNDTLQDTVNTAQHNLNLWNNLLQASRGILNPTKCVWFLFNWEFQPNGTVKLHHPQHPTITVTNPPYPPHPIKRLTHNKPHQYLGVHMTTDGNYTKELSVFHERNERYINLLRCCPFTRRKVQTVYLQCYLPTTSYPLPATHIPSHILHQAQKRATTAFLTKSGYPSTFPRAVTYATAARGGLDF